MSGNKKQHGTVSAQISIDIDDYIKLKRGTRNESRLSGPHVALIVAGISLVSAWGGALIQQATTTSSMEATAKATQRALVHEVLTGEDDLSRLRMLHYLEDPAQASGDDEALERWACQQRVAIEDNYRRGLFIRFVRTVARTTEGLEQQLRQLLVNTDSDILRDLFSGSAQEQRQEQSLDDLSWRVFN